MEGAAMALSSGGGMRIKPEDVIKPSRFRAAVRRGFRAVLRRLGWIKPVEDEVTAPARPPAIVVVYAEVDDPWTRREHPVTKQALYFTAPDAEGNVYLPVDLRGEVVMLKVYAPAVNVRDVEGQPVERGAGLRRYDQANYAFCDGAGWRLR